MRFCKITNYNNSREFFIIDLEQIEGLTINHDENASCVIRMRSGDGYLVDLKTAMKVSNMWTKGSKIVNANG